MRSRGVEVETFFRPMRDVNGSLGVTYADTRYRNNLIGTNGNALIPALFQLPGRRISNAPKFTVTGSLGWTPPIGGSGMHALFYVDGRHTSSYNTGSDLDIEKTQKTFTLVNARVGVRGPSERWAVELWAQNLFNTKYKQVAFDAPLQGSGTQRGVEGGLLPGTSTQLFGAFLGEPRTFGATLRYKWRRRRCRAPAPMPPPPPPPPATQTCRRRLGDLRPTPARRRRHRLRPRRSSAANAASKRLAAKCGERPRRKRRGLFLCGASSAPALAAAASKRRAQAVDIASRSASCRRSRVR